MAEDSDSDGDDTIIEDETTVYCHIKVNCPDDDEDILLEKWEAFAARNLKLGDRTVSCCWDLDVYDNLLVPRSWENKRFSATPEDYCTWLVHIYNKFLIPNKVIVTPNSLPFRSATGCGVILVRFPCIKFVNVNNNGEVTEKVFL